MAQQPPKLDYRSPEARGSPTPLEEDDISRGGLGCIGVLLVTFVSLNAMLIRFSVANGNPEADIGLIVFGLLGNVGLALAAVVLAPLVKAYAGKGSVFAYVVLACLTAFLGFVADFITAAVMTIPRR